MDGTIDFYLGDAGKTVTSLVSGESDEVSAVALQPDGRILVEGGHAMSALLVLRC